MSERLEQKFASGQLTKGVKSSAPQNQNSEELEQTLHNQVMSNTCPICFELFLPPNNQPFILFPCGHTFCKICISSYTKQKKKCPFCRQSIQSMAPNISLQNLILSANEKKDEVIKRLKAKQDQMLKNNAFSTDNMGQMQSNNSSISSQFDQEKYLNDYKLLDIRCGVLEEERQDHLVQLSDAKSAIRAKEITIEKLAEEREDCQARMRKLQQEMNLIQDFQEKEQESIEELRGEKSRHEQSMKFIEDALAPLKTEKEKVYMMIKTLAPHLMNELR
ncbi:zinc finger protein [Stylonychia lemnae]|uniref:Zinc finger protein n=1 Tax=Stylonychia lemnae TaxID=5949 RepID=A0A078ACL8_STYLE|nr:zinc finger protein [Stylonychia lemnae]|eukprot:CDW79924.1 zinc finger protein [Stylonychia lemnae]